MGLLGLLNQSLSVYSKSSYSADGREVVGSATTVLARFQAKTKNIMSPNGAVITIVAVAYVGPSAVIEVEDKVVYSGSNYKVYSKYPVPDGSGNINHFKLELTRWL